MLLPDREMHLQRITVNKNIDYLGNTYMVKQLKEQAEARRDILQNQATGVCIYVLIILCICTNLTK